MKGVIMSGIATLLCFLLLAGCTSQGATYNYGGAQTGTAVMAITDPSMDMGSVTSVSVTVSSVQVHSTTQGWVTVNSTPKTFNLLQLKAQGINSLVAYAQLQPGTYDQLRLEISQATVTDANGTHDAKLPSGDLTIKGDLVVTANSTSTAIFDFDSSESLHITGDGKYILAPVVQLETRDDAAANVKDNETVEINGGNVRTKVKVGMDETGRVDVGVNIPANADVSVDTSGIIHVGKHLAKGRVFVALSGSTSIGVNVSSVLVTVNSVEVHNESGWTTVSTNSKTVDLVKLQTQGTNALLTDINLQPGTYEQIRLNVSSVVVTDVNGTHTAKLPSGELKVVGNLVVNDNQTSTATFDFDVGQSLHITGDGQYILAPVIHLRTRENTQDEANDSESITISGGVVDTDVGVGMDENGRVDVGVMIPHDADVSIDVNGTMHIKSHGIGNSGNGSMESNSSIRMHI